MPSNRSRRRLHSASPKINQSSRRSEKINSERDNPRTFPFLANSGYAPKRVPWGLFVVMPSIGGAENAG